MKDTTPEQTSYIKNYSDKAQTYYCRQYCLNKTAVIDIVSKDNGMLPYFQVI